MVIARFEEESSATQNEGNRLNEEKINKLKDKHAAQLNEVSSGIVCFQPLLTLHRRKSLKRHGKQSIWMQ
jgi:hypothetical protein